MRATAIDSRLPVGAGLLPLVAACADVRTVVVAASPCGAVAVGDSVYAAAEAHGSGGFPGSRLYDSGARSGAFRWTSSDPAVIAVSDSGLLRARAPGRATIEASADGAVGRAAVKVVRVATTVAVTPEAATLRAGDSVVFRVRVTRGSLPRPATPTLFWSPADTRVGYVDAQLPNGGRFVAVAPGFRPGQWCAAGRHGVVAVTVR